MKKSHGLILIIHLIKQIGFPQFGEIIQVLLVAINYLFDIKAHDLDAHIVHRHEVFACQEHVHLFYLTYRRSCGSGTLDAVEGVHQRQCRLNDFAQFINTGMEVFFVKSLFGLHGKEAFLVFQAQAHLGL